MGKARMLWREDHKNDEDNPASTMTTITITLYGLPNRRAARSLAGRILSEAEAAISHISPEAADG